MAQYTINYSCGHAGTERLFGKTSERQKRVEWLESSGHCPACLEQIRSERQASANSAAQRWAAENNLPVLIGSEKQCSWAESVRQELLQDLPKWTTDFESNDPVGSELIQNLSDHPFDLFAWSLLADWLEGNGLPVQHTKAAAWVLKQADAKFWIDNRYENTRMLLKKLNRLQQDEFERKRKAEAEAETKAQEAEKTRKLWEEKDKIAAQARELFKGVIQSGDSLKVWSRDAEKRIYIGNGKRERLTYYHTGDRYNRPGSVKWNHGTLAPEQKEFLEKLCKQWNRVDFEL